MRLLHLQADGGFSLVEYVGTHIPRYAILSHTWGAEHEEVTFRDLVEGTGENKAGYRKLAFCGEQAAKDDLQYFWMDTCCIDRLSSAELSEAIHCMFRWYHNAAKCYVYLSDVSAGNSTGSDSTSQQTWIRAFRQSRWFTRGWTLQELLAPTCVEFFSLESERLGDKGSMVEEIHEITGISIQALQGGPLVQFSVHERMSWAESRETKREEDAAYSLLGIFNVHMPLIYGEGRENAFTRLRREIDYTSNVESLFRRNQQILLETQQLVRQQHETTQRTGALTGTQLQITFFTMPLVIVMVLFSMPPSWLPFRPSMASFIVCVSFVVLLFLLYLRVGWMVAISPHIVIKLFRSHTPAISSQDDIELQQPVNSP